MALPPPLSPAPLCILPAELVLKILLYKPNLREIVRWRTVSRWFRDITCDDLLWRALYMDSPFPRPPGPSFSQSCAYLERMLIKSAQLAQSWTTRSMREVSSVKIKLEKPLAVTPNKLISGRWLVGCEDARRFVLHDADPRAGTRACKVLWEQDEPIVSAWDVHSVSPVAGQSIVYVLLLESIEIKNKWKLLEFRLNDESGEIYDSATIDPPAWVSSFLPRVELDGGKSRFLFIPTEDAVSWGTVFDTQTGGFYALPRSRDEQVQSLSLTWHRPAYLHPFQTAFTDTHIISFDCRAMSIGEDITLIQIFAIPPDGSLVQEGKPTLCLTHQGLLESRLLDVAVGKPSVDPIGGTTTIMLAARSNSLERSRIDCSWYKLVVPKAYGLEVSRLFISTKLAISAQKEQGHIESALYFDVCDEPDMQLRGFYLGKPTDSKEREYIMKFAMYKHQRTVTCSQMAPRVWHDATALKVDPARGIGFDGLRGRLCYVDPAFEDEIVVMEIE